MPTKSLPANPDLVHLKDQAKDLLKAYKAHDREASQRIREFHPRFRESSDIQIESARFTLSDAQLAIAREYGYANWTRLKEIVEKQSRPNRDLPLHEQIEDPVFRHAVTLLDSGDASGLLDLLRQHPGLVTQRVLFEGSNYFRNPSLLEFCAENPIRHRMLPLNIVQIAKVILDAGSKTDQASMDSTLGLVCSGCVPRECGVQIPLINMLCDYGARPDGAIGAALGHGEFAAVDALLERGAQLDLTVAAATGRTGDARRMVSKATSLERQLALAYACQFGHIDIVKLLLDAGEDPNRYNPVGAHSHSTPLHQAAFYGHLSIVRLLIEHGADMGTKDILWNGTPLGWAEHGSQTDVAAYLREKMDDTRE